MPIKLVAIDMYGTLVGPGGHGEMPQGNREALKTALDSGIKIALVTGLNRASALKVLENSNVPLWQGLMIACMNGAVMFEPASGKVVWQLSHPPELAVRILEQPAIATLHPMVHGPLDPNNLMWIQQADYPELIAKYLNRRKSTLGESSLRIVKNLTDSITFPSQDICVLAPENEVHSAVNLLEDKFQSQIKLVKSQWRNGYAWLEILHPQAGKGEAIDKMCDLFGLSPDQVLAIGDNWNDVEMFQHAGVSIAMGNASDDVKQHTTHVTLPWDKAGVAHAFDQWVLTD